jgi:hypothetical protein
MIKKLATLVAAAALVLAIVPVASAQTPELPRFTRAFRRDNQPHRVYFKVECAPANHSATVTLKGKTKTVNLVNKDGRRVSPLDHFYYTHTRVARKAVRAARHGGGTIVCHLE